MQGIETMFQQKYSCPHPGTITIYNVDRHRSESFALWRSGRPVIAVGAMGTRAKQRAENEQIHLDFTYGVIDKCILKSLLGEDSLIMTTATMVDRIHQRVKEYSNESGIPIIVNMLEEEQI